MNNDIIISHKPPPSNIVCSLFGSISIGENRCLFSFGKNKNTFLGHEEINEIIFPPKQIPNLMNIKMVDCGEIHVACIDYEGKLFTFGSNIYGQLGVGKDKDELPFTHVPQQIIDIYPIDFISCGYYFTVCLTNVGNIYSFGLNAGGQLGIGNSETHSSPQLIPDLTDIEFISCGGNYVICKTYSNENYSWGSNSYGQLGQGNNCEYNKPHQCLNWPEDIIDIKCGYEHTLLLTVYGYVYSFGRNNYCGQIGIYYEYMDSINIPTLIKNIPLIKRIECGYFHTVCIDINDKLWIFGDNRYGQLGLGDNQDKFKPTLTESLHDIIDISAGGYQTFVKTANNEIYVFGYNRESQLGIKTSKNNQLTPIQAFKGKEGIWESNTPKSKAKSARN